MLDKDIREKEVVLTGVQLLGIIAQYEKVRKSTTPIKYSGSIFRELLLDEELSSKQ